MLMVNLFIFFYFMGLLSFCIKRKHLLLMLLSLEFIVVSLYLLVIIYLSFYSLEFYLSMIYLTMSVCEGVLGLSILVSLIRTHGNDYYSSFNILW
uniref:NADH dehydrogenase subunit 4L n=1 Tax=Scaphidium formosanum TaxID=2828454 RepID=UPI001BF03200|nr:NADH dehydrogenase subunit 4L [Scaphidium formosanum]QTZ18654.1 NADH dehydrogenase subunit 4L [Scaphidium formosanum]